MKGEVALGVLSPMREGHRPADESPEQAGKT